MKLSLEREGLADKRKVVDSDLTLDDIKKMGNGK